jgi:hypothetical protein
MSDLQPNNGGVPPDEGGTYRGGLPDLPPEWGSIVIPDDAAELDAEAVELRRELRLALWRGRLRRLGLAPGRTDASSIGVPIVIMAVAVITTLLSLFVVTWDHRRSATAPAGPDAGGQPAAVPVAEVTLADTTGARVRLGNLVPAILLLVGDCDCAGLIRSIAQLTPAPITVVPVGTTAPCSFGMEKNVRCLADPAGAITGRYPTAKAVASASASPSAAASAATLPSSGPSSAISAVPVPPVQMALAIPVDADGNAHDPILVDSPADLAAAVAALIAGN